jgi:hypothetical protein
MAPSSALLMVDVDGVEATRISREVPEDGWAAAAPSGAEPPFGAVCVDKGYLVAGEVTV